MAKDADLLHPFRIEIDAIDDQLVALLVRRYAVVRRVAAVKHRHDIEPFLPERVQEVLERVAARAELAGLDPAIARRLWTVIIEEACALETRLIEEESAKGA